MSLAKRIARRFRWRRNVAEGKHTRAEISKGRQGWFVEVTTNWGPRGTGRESGLDSEGTVYKAEAIDAAEEMMAKWDKEIEGQGREAFE